MAWTKECGDDMLQGRAQIDNTTVSIIKQVFTVTCDSAVFDDGSSDLFVDVTQGVGLYITPEYAS